jgi:hypothetical protein
MDVSSRFSPGYFLVSLRGGDFVASASGREVGTVSVSDHVDYSPDGRERARARDETSIPAGADVELVRLSQRVHDLHQQLRSRPLIAQAMGVLQERYRLPDADTTSALLRTTSQQHNVKMRALAAAVLAAPPPASATASRWFPGRVRPPAPEPSFVPQPPTARTTFLDSVLDAAIAHTSATKGDIQLVDPVLATLVLERHRGFSPKFVKFFAKIDTERTACAEAWRSNTRVVVPYVEHEPFYSDEARHELLTAGSRAVQSTPLIAPSGDCVGVVSTHYPSPGRRPTAAEQAQLDRIATEAGAWLSWHTHTTTLDALEDLHRLARRTET